MPLRINKKLEEFKQQVRNFAAKEGFKLQLMVLGGPDAGIACNIRRKRDGERWRISGEEEEVYKKIEKLIEDYSLNTRRGMFYRSNHS